MKTARSILAAVALNAAFLCSAGVAEARRAAPKEPAKDIPPPPVFAQDYGPGWMIRFRGVGVIPEAGSSNWTIDNIPAPLVIGPGSDLNITSTIIPELDISYFLTRNIALELILGVTPHDVESAGRLANLPVPLHDLGDIGDAWLLPPTLTLQYHFDLDYGIKPYVGAGVNYTVFFSQGSGANFHDFELDNNWGWALQAGVDFALGNNWFLNLDVKKIFLETTASVWLNPGVLGPLDPGHFITADVQIDPWLVGVGVGYRFGAAPPPLK